MLYISVIGHSVCDPESEELAYEVGYAAARRGHVIVTGGLTGIMEAACHGVHDAGGTSVGILPGADRSRANPWLTVSIPTDLGHARNALVALAGDALIAVCGGYGTLSEMAFGLKMGKPVISLRSWDLGECLQEELRVVQANSPEEAVALAERLAARGPIHPPDAGVG